MIITITGKPCSGKGTVAKLFCNKYNFEYICTGDMFRKHSIALGYENILEFQKHNTDIKQIDKLIDDETLEIGKTRLNDNIVFDSRLAWHFIPNSFKVFIDVTDTAAGERLLQANRETEQVYNLDHAIKTLRDRWNTENERYLELYSTNNLNLNNYNLVIDSTSLSPEEIVEKIYENYLKFLKNR